jgi:hypothetical protein
MKLLPLTFLAVAWLTCAGVPGGAYAADPDCVAKLADAAKRARVRINVYNSELKNMTDNPWARNSASTCSGALNRAENYYKRQTADNAICVNSDYIDNQVIHLYKSAISNCRSELSNVLSKLDPDEQRAVRDRVAKAEGGLP